LILERQLEENQQALGDVDPSSNEMLEKPRGPKKKTGGNK
jgi:hypothetical protein